MRASFAVLIAGMLLCKSAAAQDVAIYGSKAYSVYPDRVVQGEYTARALSATEITSDYQSPANKFKSPVLSFKFSINGKDNEMASGRDHQFVCRPVNGTAETPLIKFGEQLVDKTPVAEGLYLNPGTKLKIRLDMRHVFDAFNKQGYYTTPNGDKIYKDDFKGVFIAGASAPMIWDFNNLVNHPELELKDPDGDKIFETVLNMNEAKDEKTTAPVWKLSKDISRFPQYKSPYMLSDALYNLSLEEMENAVEPDGTFRTGKEWSGVWTRDISYSIILSMAVLHPEVAVNSLMRKVKDGRIIQDTGTGGAYPVSSDRMVWAIAAWEVYKVTGDKNWLNKAYAIIKKSAEDDKVNVYDPETGLFKGESSFLDWREQTYPRWMQPADIYESECLGTNAVHYQVYEVLSEMASMLNDEASAIKFNKTATGIKKGIEKYLWLNDKGYYGQYLYGRANKTVSPRAEALGEALSVLFDIPSAERQKQVVESAPTGDYGTPCIYPQIPGIPPYHNNAVWPFVESYWALAGAKVGNEQSVLKSISAIYRPAALFLTNKENFVASDGDYAGTQINSSNMLWSLSGNIAMVYKLIFGMHYEADRLIFKPFVPKALAGERSLTGFKYRQAVLDISLSGYGNKIAAVTLDGKNLSNAALPAGLTGKHTISITLADEAAPSKINVQPDYATLNTPHVSYASGQLTWLPITGAKEYKVIKNGKAIATVTDSIYKVDDNTYAQYQVIASDKNNVESFASEPVQVVPEASVITIQAEDFAGKSPLPYAGFSGKGFVDVNTKENTQFTITINAPKAGWCIMDVRYANGNGPINTENKCAIRSVQVNGQFAGALVLPQRGKGEWSDWGYSNALKVKLKKGDNKIAIRLNDTNTNMNGEVNQAMIDYVRIVKAY